MNSNNGNPFENSVVYPKTLEEHFANMRAVINETTTEMQFQPVINLPQQSYNYQPPIVQTQTPCGTCSHQDYVRLGQCSRIGCQNSMCNMCKCKTQYCNDCRFNIYEQKIVELERRIQALESWGR